MTNTLAVNPTVRSEAEADQGCGCCIRPPAEVDDKVAELESRRQAVERRLLGLQAR